MFNKWKDDVDRELACTIVMRTLERFGNTPGEILRDETFVDLLIRETQEELEALGVALAVPNEGDRRELFFGEVDGKAVGVPMYCNPDVYYGEGGENRVYPGRDVFGYGKFILRQAHVPLTRSVQREMSERRSAERKKELHTLGPPPGVRFPRYWGNFHKLDGTLFEFVDEAPGVSMDTYIEKYERPFHDIVHLAHGLIRAIAFLHSIGRVHRDLKPNNIIVDDKKNEAIVLPSEQTQQRLLLENIPRTADLLRELLEAYEAEDVKRAEEILEILASHTIDFDHFSHVDECYEDRQGSIIIGAPLYIPPEECLGSVPNETIDNERERLRYVTGTDVFPLGLTLFALASGKNSPRDYAEFGNNLNKLFLAKMKVGSAPLRFDFPIHLPAWYEKIVEQLAHPDYRRRPTLAAVDILFEEIITFGLEDFPVFKVDEFTDFIDELCDTDFQKRPEGDEIRRRFRALYPRFHQVREFEEKTGVERNFVASPAIEERRERRLPAIQSAEDVVREGCERIEDYFVISRNHEPYVTRRGRENFLAVFEDVYQRKLIAIPETFETHEEAEEYFEEINAFIQDLNAKVRTKHPKLFKGIFDCIFIPARENEPPTVWILRPFLSKHLTLAEYLEANLSETDVRARFDMLIAIAASLSALEEAGYVHTRLSSESVFLIPPPHIMSDDGKTIADTVALDRGDPNLQQYAREFGPGDHNIPGSEFQYYRLEVVELNKIEEAENHDEDPSIMPFLGIAVQVLDSHDIRESLEDHERQKCFDYLRDPDISWGRKVSFLESFRDTYALNENDELRTMSREEIEMRMRTEGESERTAEDEE